MWLNTVILSYPSMRVIIEYLARIPNPNTGTNPYPNPTLTLTLTITLALTLTLTLTTTLTPTLILTLTLTLCGHVFDNSTQTSPRQCQHKTWPKHISLLMQCSSLLQYDRDTLCRVAHSAKAGIIIYYIYIVYTTRFLNSTRNEARFSLWCNLYKNK